MTVTKGQTQMGEWVVGHGQVIATPTPAGQTFLLAGFVDPTENFSPGHLRVGRAFGFAGHVRRRAGDRRRTRLADRKRVRFGKISHGCVRVPAAALAIFAKLPTGTPVDITAS